MKKYQIYSSIILAILFVANTTSAQFNYGAKKKPATVGKDTTVTSAIATQDTANKVVAFDPNVKSVKTFDTTLVGGFNAKTKKSLRNNYAFFFRNK